jgi:hypothetical protein
MHKNQDRNKYFHSVKQDFYIAKGLNGIKNTGLHQPNTKQDNFRIHVFIRKF